MADYFVRYNVTDGVEDTTTPLIAVRMYEEGDSFFTERFDPKTSAWVHDPEVLWNVSGMGGGTDYTPVGKDEMGDILRTILARGKTKTLH